MTSIIDLRKPSIVVPSNRMNIERLYRGDLNDLEFEYFSFSRNKLYQIFSTGFFDYLNERYGLFISDYEYEDIVDKENLRTILTEDIKKFRTLKSLDFWNNFERCVINAIEKETGLFFFF